MCVVHAGRLERRDSAVYKDHEKIFSQVAVQTGYWIFVRVTNKESVRYMNLSGYVPNRIDSRRKPRTPTAPRESGN